MRRVFLVLPLLLGLAACDLVKKFDFPSPPKVDWSSISLPKGKDGKPLLIEVSGSSLALDLSAADPISAMAECADLVTYCVGGDRTLDACVANAQVCDAQRSVTPCCPKACADEFAKARKAGAEPIAAFDQVYFQDDKCFPDVAKLPGVKP